MTRQQKILLNYVIGPVLFVILAASIYLKVVSQPDLKEKIKVIQLAFTGQKASLFIVLFCLMICNWGIESRKWQLLMRPIQPVGYLRAFRAVLSGLSFSLFIPNGVGEYFGRMVYMDEGNRLKSISLSIAGSMSQVIITSIAGVISLHYLKQGAWLQSNVLVSVPIFWINLVLSMMWMGTIVLVVVYFRISWLSKIFGKISFIQRYQYFIEHLETFTTFDLTKILSLSFFRFLVFTTQYLVTLHLFEAAVPLPVALATVSVVFLVLLVLPTIPAADLGLRGQTAIQLFGLVSSNSIAIIATTTTIWFLNLILPAMAGSLFIAGIRLFKKDIK
jgi:MFS family permease